MRSYIQSSNVGRAAAIFISMALAGLAACAGTGKARLGNDDGSFAADELAPLDTPPGITIQHIKGEGRAPLKVYGNANGMTLYTSSADEKGKSKCEGECTKLWLPATATTQVSVAPDWSIIRRADGGTQWALSGKPLYTYAKDSRVGDAEGATSEHKGWAPAIYELAKMPLPPQLSVREVPDLFGQVLVNWEGRTLYLFKGGDAEQDYGACAGGREDCNLHWTPLAAPGIAASVGKFSVLRRHDGTAQWAYRGRALYTFDGDVVPGIAEGRNADALFAPAIVRRTFMPPEVKLQQVPGIAAILTNADGMTLYRRVPGSLNGRTYYLIGQRPYVPEYGYALGLKGCNSACEKQWSPLKASAHAQSTGYWYVIRRPDGSGVWTYRGSALYTYAKDKAPGEYSGDGESELLISENPQVETQLPADYSEGAANGVLTWMRAQSF